MRVLGLTGGVGMGKSTSAQYLRAFGLPAIDTDDLARLVVEPGQPALEEIRRAFGATLLTPDGRLNRREMARLVFAEPSARRRLEAILHPRIRRLWRAQVASLQSEGHSLCVVVIPLLYETGAEKELDAVVCVACSAPAQRQRLAARGWSSEELSLRISAQWPVERKLALADYAVWTEGSLEVHEAQLKRILKSCQSPCSR